MDVGLGCGLELRDDRAGANAALIGSHPDDRRASVCGAPLHECTIDCSFDIPKGDRSMATVTVSPKFQIVIPREIREKLAITPGQKIHAIGFDDRVELIPVQTARSMRGFVAGLDTRLERDDHRV